MLITVILRIPSEQYGINDFQNVLTNQRIAESALTNTKGCLVLLNINQRQVKITVCQLIL